MCIRDRCVCVCVYVRGGGVIHDEVHNDYLFLVSNDISMNLTFKLMSHNFMPFCTYQKDPLS